MGRTALVASAATLTLSCGSPSPGGAASGDGPAPAAVSTPAASESILENGFQLSWTPEGDSVLVTMSAPTTGWLAAGFHSEGAMSNAQIAIGWVDGEEVRLRDDFGTGFTTHSADTTLGGTDDLMVISGVEENGRTTISFRMPLDSGDGSDRALVPGEPCRAVLAYGNDGDDSFTGYHAWAGSVDIEI